MCASCALFDDKILTIFRICRTSSAKPPPALSLLYAFQGVARLLACAKWRGRVTLT